MVVMVNDGGRVFLVQLDDAGDKIVWSGLEGSKEKDSGRGGGGGGGGGKDDKSISLASITAVEDGVYCDDKGLSCPLSTMFSLDLTNATKEALPTCECEYIVFLIICLLFLVFACC
jgi:hypothetical protein